MVESGAPESASDSVSSSNQGTSVQDAARKLVEENPAGLTPSVLVGEKPAHSTTSNDRERAIQDTISSAQKLIADKQFSLVSTMLEKAVETYSNSEDIWILYLQLKSQMVSSGELLELYKLFHTAVSSCPSYAVIWEVRPLP